MIKRVKQYELREYTLQLRLSFNHEIKQPCSTLITEHNHCTEPNIALIHDFSYLEEMEELKNITRLFIYLERDIREIVNDMYI